MAQGTLTADDSLVAGPPAGNPPAAGSHAATEPPRRVSGGLFDRDDFVREFSSDEDREIAESVGMDRRRRARNQGRFKGEHAERRPVEEPLREAIVDTPCFMLDEATLLRLDGIVAERMAEMRERWSDEEYEARYHIARTAWTVPLGCSEE